MEVSKDDTSPTSRDNHDTTRSYDTTLSYDTALPYDPTLPSYDTTLPLPLDCLSFLAYPLGLPGALILLLTEHKNDLVRFHAWQSFLLSGLTLWGQLVLAWWRPEMVGWITIGYMVVGCYLGWLAYRGAPALQAFYLPVIGTIAAEWVRSE